MKKLIIGIFGLLIAIQFCFNLKSSKIKSKPPLVDVTLNGVDEAIARQAINNFANNYDLDTGPKSFSVFYNIDQIRAMNTVLKAENGDQRIKTDGVRMYLGSDQPVSGNTKLTLDFFLVSTREKATVNPNHTSTHVDYYIHTGGVLSTTEIGVVSQSASTVVGQGGTLYGGTAPTDGRCTHPGTHFLPTGVAYEWVRARRGAGGDVSAYNTKSEWFPFCFISNFFEALDVNGYSGLRIYLAEGYILNGVARDVFILVPTKKSADLKSDIDSYDCLEDLRGTTLCNDTALLKILRHNKFVIPKTGAGYDKGELCPDNCN